MTERVTAEEISTVENALVKVYPSGKVKLTDLSGKDFSQPKKPKVVKRAGRKGAKSLKKTKTKSLSKNKKNKKS